MPFYKRPSRNSGSSRRGARGGMQSGPRGGRFYLSRGGSKVYGPLPEPSTRKGRKARPARKRVGPKLAAPRVGGVRKARPAKKGAGPKAATPRIGGVRKSSGGQKAVSKAWVKRKVTSGAKKASQARIKRFAERVGKTTERDRERATARDKFEKRNPGPQAIYRSNADRKARVAKQDRETGKRFETRSAAIGAAASAAGQKAKTSKRDFRSASVKANDVLWAAADATSMPKPEKPTSKTARAGLMAKSAKADRSKPKKANGLYSDGKQIWEDKSRRAKLGLKLNDRLPDGDAKGPKGRKGKMGEVFNYRGTQYQGSSEAAQSKGTKKKIKIKMPRLSSGITQKKKGQVSKGSTEAKQSKGTKKKATKKTTNKSGMTDRQKTSYDRLRKIGWNHSRALNKAAGKKKKKKKASMSGIKSVSDMRKSLSGKQAPEKTWEDRFKSATSGKKKAVKPIKPTRPSMGSRLRKHLGLQLPKRDPRQWSRGKNRA